MRLAAIAKELRITTQELRRELEKTNFGIDPMAREIDDSLAAGILRFLKGRVKPTLTHRRAAKVFEEEEGIAPEATIEGEEVSRRVKRTHIIRKEGDVRKNEIIEEKPKAEQAPETEEKQKAPKPEDSIKNQSSETSTNVDVPDSEESNEKVAEKKEKKVETVNDRLAAKFGRTRPPVRKNKEGGSKSKTPISRRIELDKNASFSGVNKEKLPKNFYKKKGKGKKRRGQDQEILSVGRRPTKAKVSRVHYDVSEGNAEVSLEELAIERQMDQERFRAQKKSRSAGQMVVPNAQPQIKAKEGIIEIPEIVSVKEFSEKTGLPVTSVIANLMKNGIMATINQIIDYDTASIIADELQVEIIKQEKAASSEDLLMGDIKALLEEDDKSKLITRPPIVTIMGHVDHGKTKLLDTIRNANVVAGESGGITQHIGAYQVKKNDHLITFLDTPGHEAFTSMRARGAKVTDIAILVVAADEGVKPQTIEAINHAKEAGVPIIVAINKMDKPNANPDKVKGELAEHGLQSEDWGGETIMVPVSALKGDGIDNILEMILLVAEMENLKANPNRMAVGTVIESHLDPSLGPVATIVVNSGTLKTADAVVVGDTYGRIKSMCDHNGNKLRDVPPAGAVRISGLNTVPKAGDILQAFISEKMAKQRLAELRELRRHQEESQAGSMVERIVSQINKGDIKYLKLVLKADTKGSLEAILQALNKIKSYDVAVKVIHCGVGNISDTDVAMAAASQAILVGFHVVPANAHVEKLAQRQGLDIKDYAIIYKLTEDITAILSGMLEPEINMIELGKLKAKQVFFDKKKWVILGCEVVEGKVEKGAMTRVMRNGEMLFETQIESLKHVSEDVNELEKGAECGVRIRTPKPVELGDILEVYKIEKKERTLL